MKKTFDPYTIYDFSDKEIVMEICRRIKAVRMSCCVSQQEFAQEAGVSIITIKRLESGKVADIALSTLLKILRASTQLEGVANLVPKLPPSPFLTNPKTQKKVTRCNSKRKAI